tara:strand:+ start:297 stop:458 length:162 start_codon:yes stop_codon:yes gene_type:complete
MKKNLHTTLPQSAMKNSSTVLSRAENQQQIEHNDKHKKFFPPIRISLGLAQQG